MQRSLTLLMLLLLGCSPQSPPPEEAKAPTVPSSWSAEGFLRADRPREFSFPEDHGPHQGYRTEWWYLTGNLQTSEGHRFGYQFTLFRIALTSGQAAVSASRWRTSHIWMGHLALTDIERQRHYHEERFAREAVQLAGAKTQPLRIWLEDWQLSQQDPRSPWRLNAEGEQFGLQLELMPLRAPVLQGDKGLSQKGSEPGNASYYYSITRLASSGTLRLEGESVELSGLSWLDREWSTSALDENQAGWDWFSLQLDDGKDLMFYRLREKSGTSSSRSAGKLVDEAGEVTLRLEDVVLTPRRWWSSSDGIRYPVSWELEIKPLQRRLLIDALVDDQEMDVSVRYWEGAVRISEDGKIVGQGYLEMTGY